MYTMEDKLKDAVMANFNQSLLTTYDAQQLALSVFKKTNKNISYNTVRRFFNIVPSTNKPSVFTLNILSEYVGYGNWEKFRKESILIEQNELSIYLLISNVNTHIDFDRLEDLSVIHGQQKEFHFLLRNLVTLAFNRKEYDFFRKLFTLKHVFNIIASNMLEIYYTVNFIGIYIRRDEYLQKIVIKHYADLPLVDMFYVEYFVDLDSINGYFGILLDVYFKKKVSDKQAVLFYNCMKFYGCYLRKDFKKYKTYYKEIDKINNFDGIYNVPISRKRVCELIYSLHYSKCVPANFHETLLFDIYYLKKRNDLVNHLVEYITHVSQGLFWCKQYALIKPIVEEFLLEKPLAEKFLSVKQMDINHIANNRWNQLKVYYSVSLYYSKEKAKAKKFFNTVKESIFEVKQFSTISKDYNDAKRIINA